MVRISRYIPVILLGQHVAQVGSDSCVACGATSSTYLDSISATSAADDLRNEILPGEEQTDETALNIGFGSWPRRSGLLMPACSPTGGTPVATSKRSRSRRSSKPKTFSR